MLALKLVYGRDDDEKTDYFVKLGEHLVSVGGAALLPGSRLINAFPIREYFIMLFTVSL